MRARRGSQNQKELASELGFSALTISHLERGTHGPSIDTARELAKWLGWTMEQVLDAADAPPTEPSP